MREALILLSAFLPIIPEPAPVALLGAAVLNLLVAFDHRGDGHVAR